MKGRSRVIGDARNRLYRVGNDRGLQRRIIMNVTKILVPLDHSDYSDRALQWGASLAEKYGAQLLLLHVVSRAAEDLPARAAVGTDTPLQFALDNPSVYYAASPPPREAVSVIDVFEMTQNDLKDLAIAKLNKSLRVSPKVGVGKPAEEILRVAQEEAVDLIVMGTHGRTGLRHVLMGSVAETVMRTAPCPVFTVKVVSKPEHKR